MAKSKKLGDVAAPAADVVVAPDAVAPEVVAEAPAAPVTPDTDRQARWNAFLAAVEAQATAWGTLDIFNVQKKNGEFNKIPDSF